MKAFVKKDLILSRFSMASILLYFPIIILILGIMIEITEDVIVTNSLFISFIVLNFIYIYLGLFDEIKNPNENIMIYSLPIDKSKLVLSRYVSLMIMSWINCIPTYMLLVLFSSNPNGILGGYSLPFHMAIIAVFSCILLSSFILPFDFARSTYSGTKPSGKLRIVLGAGIILIILFNIPYLLYRLSGNPIVMNIFRDNIRLSSYILMSFALILYFASYKLSKFFFDKANMLI